MLVLGRAERRRQNHALPVFEARSQGTIYARSVLAFCLGSSRPDRRHIARGSVRNHRGRRREAVGRPAPGGVRPSSARCRWRVNITVPTDAAPPSTGPPVASSTALRLLERQAHVRRSGTTVSTARPDHGFPEQRDRRIWIRAAPRRARAIVFHVKRMFRSDRRLEHRGERSPAAAVTAPRRHPRRMCLSPRRHLRSPSSGAGAAARPQSDGVRLRSGVASERFRRSRARCRPIQALSWRSVQVTAEHPRILAGENTSRAPPPIDSYHPGAAGDRTSTLGGRFHLGRCLQRSRFCALACPRQPLR